MIMVLHNRVRKFAEENWSKINNFGLSIDDLIKGLSFIAYNYEIEFENTTYLQTRGCAMGSHYGPPFAIIAVHFIETEALNKLSDIEVKPSIFLRFIDDVILGPFERNTAIFDNILNTFNSIKDDIQFTIEVPEVDSALNFLDISVSIVNSKVKYEWYSKPTHSDITLQKDSWLPQHIKNNYIVSTKDRIANRCSSSTLKEAAISRFHDRLLKNNYSNSDFSKKKTVVQKNDTHNSNNQNDVKLVLNFVTDSCNRKINRLIKKFDLPVTLISKPDSTMSQYFYRKRSQKHVDCGLCESLDDKFPCDVRFVVYKFTCSHCCKFYIGQTNRPFKVRYEEHARSLKLKNKNSALSEHAVKDHDSSLTISDFIVKIIGKHKSPVENRLAEARFIKDQKPALNRKHELVG